MRSLPCILVCIVLALGLELEGTSANIEINFNQSTYFTAKEDEFNFTLVLTSTEKMFDKITVLVQDDCTVDKNSSVSSTPYNVTFPKDYLSISQNVLVSADDLPVKFFICSITPNDNDNVNVAIGNTTAYTTIEHFPKVNFAKKDYKVKENSGSVFIKLDLKSDPSSSDIDVKVTTFNINSDNEAIIATDTDDYSLGSNVVTIPAGSTSALLTISLHNDDILEGNETFHLMIDSDIVETDQFRTTVTIIDTTVVSVQFSELTYSVNESGRIVQPVLVQNGSTAIDFTVYVNVADISATEWSDNNTSTRDYKPETREVSFKKGINIALLNISIFDDNLLEDDETFNVTIDSSSLPSNVIIVDDASTAIVTILDDDVVSVQFNASTYSVNESGEIVQPVLVLSGSTAINFTVHVNVTDMSATKWSDNKTGDYKSETPLVVSFNEGVSNISVNISIVDDNLLEEDEKFSLTIDSSSLHSNVMVDEPGNTTVTILDDDTTSVYFENSTYSISENEGTVQLTLVLSNPSTITIPVHLYVNGSSAIPGEDYEFKNDTPVIFQSEITKTKFNISIIDDELFEQDENFAVTIEPSSLPNKVNVGNVSTAIVTILDNDPVSVYFENSTYSISENEETVQLTLVLSNPSTITIPVRLYVSGSSAIPGEDYEFKNDTPVIFQSEITKTKFNISIIDDTLFEQDENFTVTIDPSSLPNKVNVGNASTATVTILDNDPEPTTPTTSNPVTSNSSTSTPATTASTATATTASTATATTITTSSVPTPTSASTASGGFGFGSLFYASIILLLVLVPAAYVYHQNREKIHGCLRGRRAGRAGKIRYQLLPNSVGEALRSSHRD